VVVGVLIVVLLLCMCECVGYGEWDTDDSVSTFSSPVMCLSELLNDIFVVSDLLDVSSFSDSSVCACVCAFVCVCVFANYYGEFELLCHNVTPTPANSQCVLKQSSPEKKKHVFSALGSPLFRWIVPRFLYLEGVLSPPPLQPKHNTHATHTQYIQPD